jgi:hypothetical protein
MVEGSNHRHKKRFDKFVWNKFEQRSGSVAGPEGVEGRTPGIILSPAPIDKKGLLYGGLFYYLS